MARTAKNGPTKSISVALPEKLFDAIDEARWDHRKEFRDVVREAMSDWAEKHGIAVPDNSPTK